MTRDHNANDLIAISERGREYRLYLPGAGKDYIQTVIAERGFPYELEMLRDIAQTFSKRPRNQCFVDVGANVGNHALYLSQVADRKVVCFEPNAALCDILRKSIAVNSAEETVRLYEVAVSDEPGHALFGGLDPANLGGQSIISSPKSGDTFPVVKLDQYEWGTPVGVLKVDVEGHESRVLLGAKDMIERHRPAIYVECLEKADFIDVHGTLDDLDYCYLETFNATPTHKYLHRSDVENSGWYVGGIQSVLSDYNLRADLARNRR